MYSYGNVGEVKIECLLDETKRLREDLLVYEGNRLFYEEIIEGGSLHDSPAYKAFVISKNKINIRINKPPVQDKFDYLVSADLRWNVMRLREAISEELGESFYLLILNLLYVSNE